MRIFRYLAKETFTTMLAVSAILLVVVISGRFVKYLAEAAAGKLAAEVLMSIILYRLPGFLELILPLGLFIGILLAYGRLYVESEMVVLSACGLSTGRLLWYTMIPAFVVAGLVAGLSLYLTPVGVTKAQEIFNDPAKSTGVSALAGGRFQSSDAGESVTYAETVGGTNQQMEHVFLSTREVDASGRSRLTLTIAESGAIRTIENGEKRYLELKNGYRYLGNAGELDFSVVKFAKLGELIHDDPDRLERPEAVDGKSTQLLLQSAELQDIAALQWRLSIPLLVPIVALLALSLSRTDHRRGRFAKLLPAFLLYMVYLVSLSACREAIEKGTISPQPGIWWIHGLFLTLALLMLYAPGWWLRVNYLRRASR
ncbi:MAG: lipopolysaccharide export system permease protein [Halieaceae bacterium]|jgi:lipopolysaccharide export system permease protein